MEPLNKTPISPKKTTSILVYALMGAFVLAALLTGYLTFIAVRDFVTSWEMTDLPGIPLADEITSDDTEGILTNANTPMQGVEGPEPQPWDGASRVTVLVMGLDYRDWETGDGPPRTDTMILLTIDPLTKTGGMLNIPRDLWVYIPNHTMDRINTAYAWGASNGYPGGGFGLLQDLFRYNLGIELDHYARVNFTGFQEIIERLGGLVISVDCALTDWRLKDPALDPGLEESWEEYTLGIGHYRLDPYMALWYVRSRKTTTEIDRGRRQMDVLRAMWQQMQSMGLLAQIEQLWPLVTGWVDTDLSLTDMLALVPLATTLDPISGNIKTAWTQIPLPLAHVPSRQEIEKDAQSSDRYLSTRCLLYTSPSPRDRTRSRMPSSA